jgi:tetraacyldisaccharide 4'-kinase
MVGDEALLLAALAPTWVARNRAAGAAAAAAAGAQVIVMDDGFQNPGLHKDLALLVIDTDYGLGNRRVIPAGPLRERAAAGLARADGVVLLGEAYIGETEKNLIGDLPQLRARLTPRRPDLAGQRVYAFAGIGRPEKFFATLEALDAQVVGREAFADHAPYDPATLARLAATAEAAGARLVTTAKDAVRLGPAAGVTVLDVDLAWDDKEALLRLLEPVIGNHTAPA